MSARRAMTPKAPARPSSDLRASTTTAVTSYSTDNLPRSRSSRDLSSTSTSGLKSSILPSSPSKPDWNDSTTSSLSSTKSGRESVKGPFVSKTMSMTFTLKKSENDKKSLVLTSTSTASNCTISTDTSVSREAKSTRVAESAQLTDAETTKPSVEDETKKAEETRFVDVSSRNFSIPTASSASKSRAPLYANRYSSAAEAVSAFHESLRNSTSFKPVKQKGSSLSSPKSQTGSSTPNRNSQSLPSRRDSGRNKFSPQYNDDAAEFLTALRNQRGSNSGDGKPSTGTIEEQWQFLRSYFKMADDDLEWLMVAKHKGAYKYANNKHDEAEDRYFQGLAEMEAYELQCKQMMQADGIGEIPGIISQLSELVISNLVVDPVALNNFNIIKEKLRAALESLEASRGAEYITTLFSSRTIEMFKQILTEGILPSKAVRRAKELNASVKEEFGRLKKLINDSKKLSDTALDDMEKWSRRIKEADEYASAVHEEEEEWLDREYDDNYEALCLMRSYIPINIADLTISQLMELAKQRGGWLTLELASEIKNNRLLHWLVSHKDDIALANFLAGEKKSYFENIESLDIIELRALVICLPEKFELDGDGRKNEWRSRVMARAKQMVSQQKGETVKGGWNMELQRRTDVKLAPLKPEQERRSIYYYRNKEQSLQRLKQYDDREATLKKKTAWLETAKREAEEAKKEYDIILNEMRDADLKAQYGADQVNLAKKMAKEQWQEAESKRKGLERDIAQLKATIAANPVSREDFVISMKETEEFLASKGFVWEDKDQSPILIEGVFDRTPDINRTERKATKFVSAEEEANIRKNELAALKAQKESAASENLAANTGNDSTAVAPESEEAINTANASDENAAVEDEKSTDNPNELSDKPLKRRSSILNSANPDMVKALTRMMSSTGVSDTNTPVVVKRASVQRSTSITDSAKEGSASEEKAEVKEVKITKSKFLMKLSGEGAPETSSPSPALSGRPPMPSFLDQLKSRGNPLAAAQSTGDDEGDGNDTKPKTSFLDELKLKAKKGKADA